ncbi:MAG: hypothetical protein ACE5JH_00445 [Acidobacteriota bacterium]
MMKPALAKSASTHRDGVEGRAPLALPVLLADQQGVAFVATARGFESLRVPRRFWAVQVGVVPIPASDEEILSSELLQPAEAGTWPMVAPRPELLAPALSRLLGCDHVELSLQPSRDGLRAALLTREGDEQPFPIAPKDALGFLAAIFRHAPRGVVRTSGGTAHSVLLAVRPAVRRHEYRVRLAAVVPDPPPATLAEVGLSPALMEMVLDSLDRAAGLVLVSGGPNSGRSTTLSMFASILVARGQQGGRVGQRAAAWPGGLVWMAESISDWPFPESLHALAPDFVIIEQLGGAGDLVLAARLAATGRLVFAGAPAADPESLARRAARDLEAGAAPPVPIAVLGQALLRGICRGCRSWATIPVARARRLGFHRRDLEEMERRGGLVLPRGQGCDRCAGTGASGLTCAFEYFGPEEGNGSLPRLREEGWRKAIQGQTAFEDVCALPGAHRTMRTLREIQVHAGQSPSPAGAPLVPAEGPRGGRAAGRPAPAPASTPAGGSVPAVAESKVLAELFREAHRGSSVDPGSLPAIARSIAARAAGDGPVQEALAPASGFHLAQHSINTALIGVRLWRFMKTDADAAQIARLGLLHDVGLLGAGLDPDESLGPATSEGTIDTSGSRFEPRPMLGALGCDDETTAALIEQVHTMLQREPLDSRERGRIDVRAQVIALASLLDLHRHATNGDRPLDLHEVTSLMVERHGKRFGPPLFRALLRAIPLFPIGSLVELSSGDLARVVSLNQDNHFRPRVEIAACAAGERPSERRVVDLARAPFLHIRRRVIGAAAGARERP